MLPEGKLRAVSTNKDIPTRDAIVIGSGIGGLAAAAALGKRGHRVLLRALALDQQAVMPEEATA